MSNPLSQRTHIVTLAKTWLGTPYHTGAKRKQVGADCLTLLAGIYEEAGMIPPVQIPYYPNDWHLHRSDERYMQGILHYAHEVQTPLAGDIALWKFGRCFSHGAIVVDYPLMIHAYVGRECVLEDVSKADWLNYVGEKSLKRREVKYFSLFA